MIVYVIGLRGGCCEVCLADLTIDWRLAYSIQAFQMYNLIVGMVHMLNLF